jgi:hypothetical protein
MTGDVKKMPQVFPFDPGSPDDAIAFIEQFLMQEDQVIKLELTKVGVLYQGEATLRAPD